MLAGESTEGPDEGREVLSRLDPADGQDVGSDPFRQQGGEVLGPNVCQSVRRLVSLWPLPCLSLRASAGTGRNTEVHRPYSFLRDTQGVDDLFRHELRVGVDPRPPAHSLFDQVGVSASGGPAPLREVKRAEVVDGDHRGGLPGRRHDEVRPVDQVDPAGVELDGWERPSGPRCVEHPGGEAGARRAERLHPRRKEARDPTAAPPADGECADLQVRPCRERLEDSLQNSPTPVLAPSNGVASRATFNVTWVSWCPHGVSRLSVAPPADRLAGASGAAAYPGRGVARWARYAGAVCGHWEPGHSAYWVAGTWAPGHWVSACVTVSVIASPAALPLAR